MSAMLSAKVEYRILMSRVRDERKGSKHRNERNTRPLSIQQSYETTKPNPFKFLRNPIISSPDKNLQPNPTTVLCVSLYTQRNTYSPGLVGFTRL